MNKYLVYIGVFVVLIIGIAVFAVFYQSKLPVYNPENEGECGKIIYQNTTEKKVNVVFLNENVARDYAEQYAKALLEIEPFSSNKEKINFFYADKPIVCKVENSALLCYSKELLKAASSCPNDYIVVLSQKDKRVRSSAYINVLSINTAQVKTTLAHEFAHVFGNIADEYVPAGLPSRQKNCVSSCENFDGLNEGCFDGCAKTSLKRSVEAGLMKTLQSREFGRFNKMLLSKELGKYDKENA